MKSHESLSMNFYQSLILLQNHSTKTNQSQATLDSTSQLTLFKLGTLFSLLLFLTLEEDKHTPDFSFPENLLNEVCCVYWIFAGAESSCNNISQRWSKQRYSTFDGEIFSSRAMKYNWNTSWDLYRVLTASPGTSSHARAELLPLHCETFPWSRTESW